MDSPLSERTLSRSILARPAGADCLALSPAGRLGAGRARALGPAPQIAPEMTVAVSVADGLALLETLIALDGQVAGLLLVSAAAGPGVVAGLAAAAGAAAVISDRGDLDGALPPAAALGPAGPPRTATTWMMTTSGTTGLPKIVPHTLQSLARSVRRDPLARAPVWGMVYEMTRFAGLQVALQSLIGGGTLALAPRQAPLAEQIGFLAASGVTHLSATPTLWRRLLMAPGAAALPLRQATMGGEIADQAVLDAAARQFPQARLTHIYASTEAGVGFAVNDRRAGFPLAYAEDAPGGTGIRIRDGLLWLRPPGGRVARYLGGQALETDADGYVNTGDRLEVAGDRAVFLGRDSGVVNIGGVKVHPERVEHVIAAVDGVGLAAVSSKKSPITGALLVATVVPADPQADRGALKARILEACRGNLEREAVPARIAFADTLETNAAGKIARL
ncbi:fatty acid--CoA ligase family protein [Poseidonocella sp. HB161398]|uniref:ANL family adenylate-forming protein n=1 Tax=Poseidonocella sp. HB161398 TaxID=2320855 RepID=UPI0011080A73|nr:class I adenylate-forming enzyme family protein [Poseidonocella sp. HB161398]